MRLSNILVATDFGESSDAALRYGRELARTFGARIHLLHVVDDVMASTGADLWGQKYPELQAEVEDTARMHLERIVTDEDRQQLGATAVVRSGPAASVIVNYAQHEAIDLIVVGTHGRTGLPRVLVGSVAERVVRTAPCAVLTARERTR